MEICCLNGKKEECGGEEGCEITVTCGQPGKIAQLQPIFGVSCDCGGCPVYQIWMFRSCWRENPVIVGEFNDTTIWQTGLTGQTTRSSLCVCAPVRSAVQINPFMVQCSRKKYIDTYSTVVLKHYGWTEHVLLTTSWRAQHSYVTVVLNLYGCNLLSTDVWRLFTILQHCGWV